MRQPLDPDLFAGCDGSAVPMRVGDKWTGKLLRCLDGGPRRFTELQRALGITPKVLAESLRSMERNGLLTRTDQLSVPARVDYELTPLGRTLFQPLEAQCSWAAAHLHSLAAAQQAYDDRTAQLERVGDLAASQSAIPS